MISSNLRTSRLCSFNRLCTGVTIRTIANLTVTSLRQEKDASGGGFHALPVEGCSWSSCQRKIQLVVSIAREEASGGFVGRRCRKSVVVAAPVAVVKDGVGGSPCATEGWRRLPVNVGMQGRLVAGCGWGGGSIPAVSRPWVNDGDRPRMGSFVARDGGSGKGS